MDQGTLVGNEIESGRRFIERFVADGNPVRAAFWLKTAEEGLFYLYVATDLYDQQGPAASYRAVHASLKRLAEPRVSSSEIKVVSPDDPIVTDIRRIVPRNPRQPIARSGSEVLGSVEADHIYVYPNSTCAVAQPNSMTTDEVSREILRLMNRGSDQMQPSRIALRNGDVFRGVPTSLYLGAQNAIVASFIPDGEIAPRMVRLDEINSIH